MAAQLRDRPDSYRGYWFAARFMRGDGDLAAAGAAYARAMDLWPHRRALVVEAAANAAEAGQRGRAAALARMVIDQWPDDVSGYRMLAGNTACAENLDDDARAAAAEPLADFLAALHAIPVAGLGAPVDDLGRGDMSKRIPMAESYLKRCSELGLIGDERPFLRILADTPIDFNAQADRSCCPSSDLT